MYLGLGVLRVLLCNVKTTGDYMQETLTVELTSKLRVLLDRTKEDMLIACENGLQVAATRNDGKQMQYWREEFNDINNLRYEELFLLFVEMQYRRMH